MNITHLKLAEDEKILNPVQKEFNRLNAKIEKIRNDIEKIPAKIDIIRNFQIERLNPIRERHQILKFEFLKKLNYMYDTTKLTLQQKETLANIILEDAGAFSMEMQEHPDIDAVKEIHDKYTKILYSEEEAEQMRNEEKDILKSMSETFFGLDMDGFDELDENEYEDFFRKKMEEKISKEHEEFEEFKQRQNSKKHKSKKTPAQQQKEDAKKMETDASLKTLREVYTDLVKKLHPDREKDEKLRFEKTEQMKQITEAYEKKDLATLLIMQINWLQHTDKDPRQQPDDVLARYNNVLKMHIKKLEQEYAELIHRPLPFDSGFAHIDTFRLLSVSERTMQNYLASHERNMNKELAHEETGFANIHTINGLKRYIKKREEENGLDDFFMQMLCDF
jgi:hypothetical protein